MKKLTAISAVLAFALAAFLVGRYSGGSSGKEGASSQRILFYVDPMHPAYGITVTSGLRFGDRIVIARNFLIDSESRMHSSTRASSSQSPARSMEAGVEVDQPAQGLGAHRGTHA